MIGFSLLYLMVGAGCGAALSTRQKRVPLGDVGMLLVAWPLLAPMLLMTSEPARSDEFSRVMADARTGPLGPLLPDEQTVSDLAARLVAARERVAEIDLLLTQPGFDEAAALARAVQHRALGDDLAAEAADTQVTRLRGLRALRDRYRRELAGVTELLNQLKLQAQVARLAGDGGSSVRELTRELLARIEGIDRVVDSTST